MRGENCEPPEKFVSKFTKRKNLVPTSSLKFHCCLATQDKASPPLLVFGNNVCASLSSPKYDVLSISLHTSYQPSSSRSYLVFEVVFPKVHQATTYSDVADALSSLESLIDFVYSGITAKITQEKSRLTALSSRIEVAQVSSHLLTTDHLHYLLTWF